MKENQSKSSCVKKKHHQKEVFMHKPAFSFDPSFSNNFLLMKTSQAQGTLGKEFWDAALSPRSLRMYILALVVRLILIAYGEWQDANSMCPYL